MYTNSWVWGTTSNKEVFVNIYLKKKKKNETQGHTHSQKVNQIYYLTPNLQVNFVFWSCVTSQEFIKQILCFQTGPVWSAAHHSMKQRILFK